MGALAQQEDLVRTSPRRATRRATTSSLPRRTGSVSAGQGVGRRSARALSGQPWPTPPEVDAQLVQSDARVGPAARLRRSTLPAPTGPGVPEYLASCLCE